MSACWFLRSTNRKKEGKDHRYFSIVEKRRVSADKTVQRTVLYLGEIDEPQQASLRIRLPSSMSRSSSSQS